MFTAFHPQTDEQTEKINQTLEQYLRYYVNYKQDNWVALLLIAQYAYNSAYNKRVKMSPFEANYGFGLTMIFTKLVRRTSETAVKNAESMVMLQQNLRDDIDFIHARTAAYNKKRSEGPTFKGGDKVYLLTKNIQTKRPSKKLDWKKVRPFRIRKVKRPVNYELYLPKTMKIHPVFHISMLEPAPGGTPDVPTMPIEVEGSPEYEVEEILDSQVIRGKIRYLVKWLGYPDSENS